MKCPHLLVPHLGPIYHATFELRVYQAQWRDSVTIVLRKPTKLNHTVPGAHWPITLLNTIAKILSTFIAEDLT